MQVIENQHVKEKVYVEQLTNGLTVLIIPKPQIQKKFVMWATNYGSIDSEFIPPNEKNPIKVPDGVAHFLEHKLFEQKNGTNSLDTLTNLGASANAYTTNDHTAYLYGSTDNFYEALDELMDYVQNPYFTDENVDKEKGIIIQEIKMYEDYPEWVLYLNCLKAMYNQNPIKIDITGTERTVKSINKDILYKCYETFYNHGNMIMLFCGDFVPEEVIKEVQKRLIEKQPMGEIERIYPIEEEEIVKPTVEAHMQTSMPMFAIGIKDNSFKTVETMVKRHIAIEIALNMIIGKSSDLYKELYESQIMQEEPDLDYEFSKIYAHVIISGFSKEPKTVLKRVKERIKELQKNGVDKETFERIKKCIYGSYIREYNRIEEISRMFINDYFKGINSFDYLENINSITKEYVEQVINTVFMENKMVLSVVK
jgi:predicted Zn-dependent peptidase